MTQASKMRLSEKSAEAGGGGGTDEPLFDAVLTAGVPFPSPSPSSLHDEKGVAVAVAVPATPWPMPPARSQYIFCVTAMWMLFPVILMSAPTFFRWESNAYSPKNIYHVLFSLYFWLFSAFMSVVHWGRYVARGMAQILDVAAAAAAGISSVVEAFLYVDNNNNASSEYGLLVSLLVVILTLGYCESAKPHWDTMNGFIFHNLLRFAAIWLFAVAAGRPSRSTCSGAAWWTFLLTASVYAVDTYFEVRLVNRARKKEYGYNLSTVNGGTSQLQPTFGFKAVGLIRTFIVVLCTAMINALIWAPSES